MRSGSSGWWWRLTLMVVALSLVSACAPLDAPRASRPRDVAVLLGPSGATLNPYSPAIAAQQVGSLLLRGMFDVDAEGYPVPDLCTTVPTRENGLMTPDGLVVTYLLDPDAVWTDGTPVTSADVAFTWDLLERGVLTDAVSSADIVSDVEIVDEHTLRVRLARPDAPFAWHFVPYVLPMHLLNESPDVLSDGYWLRPTGCTGWTVASQVKGVLVELHDQRDRVPFDLRVYFCDDDGEARAVWDSSPAAVWLDPPSGAVGTEVYAEVPSSSWDAFVMNLEPGHATADLSVRQAFSEIATVTVAAGDAGPFGQPFSEQSSRDVAAALTRDGWRTAADGSRQRSGEPLVLRVYANPANGPEGDRIEDMDYARFGIEGQLFPAFDYTDFNGGGALAQGQFDVALVRVSVPAPYGWAWPYASGDVPSAENPRGANIARVADGALDASAEAMRAAGSPEELRSAVATAWARLESLSVVVWDKNVPSAVLVKGVDSVKPEPFAVRALEGAATWSIPTHGSAAE